MFYPSCYFSADTPNRSPHVNLNFLKSMPIVIRGSWGKLSLFLFSHKAQAKLDVREGILLVHAGKLTLKTLVLTWCPRVLA